MTRENLWLVKCTDRDGDDVDDLREEHMAGHLAHIEAIVDHIAMAMGIHFAVNIFAILIIGQGQTPIRSGAALWLSTIAPKINAAFSNASVFFFVPCIVATC